MSKSTLAAFVVSLLVLVGCGKDEKRPASGRYYSEAVEDVMETYSDAVFSELLPKVGESDPGELRAPVDKLAVKHLLPHKKLLAQEGELILGQLPKAEPIDRSKWTTVWRARAVDLAGWEDLKALTGRDDGALILAARFWDPEAVARSWFHVCLDELFGPDESRNRFVLCSYIGWRNMKAADADPARPVIAFKLGPEIWLITLERCNQGGYLPAETEYLKHKSALSTEHAQPSTLPAE